MWNPYVKRSAYTSISHFDVTSIYEMLCICIHFTFLCDMYVWNALYIYTNHILMWYLCVKRSVHVYIQPIADRVTQNLEIISKNFHLVPGVPTFLMGFIISTMYCVVLIVTPIGRMLVRWKGFGNNLEILCHPICNRLCQIVMWYLYVNHSACTYIITFGCDIYIWM